MPNLIPPESAMLLKGSVHLKGEIGSSINRCDSAASTESGCNPNDSNKVDFGEPKAQESSQIQSSLKEPNGQLAKPKQHPN